MTSTTATTTKAAPLTLEQAQARLAELLGLMTEANTKMTAMGSMNPIPYTEFSALSAESKKMRDEFDKVTKRIVMLKEKQEKAATGSATKQESTENAISDEKFAQIQEAIETAGLTVLEFAKCAQVKELVNAARMTRATPEETKNRLAKALRYVRQGFPQSVAAEKAGVTTQQLTANGIATVAMTFVNPADKAVTWASGGKGQFPQWFHAHIKAGRLPIELVAGYVADQKAEDEEEAAPF